MKKSLLPVPWKHQKKTQRLLNKEPFVFDMSDPGTGKTRPAIDHWASKGTGRMLVIAVKSNLESVWQAEIRRWQPSMIPVVALAENRMEAFRSKHADVIITNSDATKWIMAQGAKFFRNLGIKKVLFDESTFFKNRQPQRSKGARWVRNQPSIDWVELLSGTPNPLTVLELWHQAMLLDQGARLGREFFRFRAAVCAPTSVRVAGGREITKWDDIEGAEEAVFGLLNDVSIRHEFEKCTSIPENTLRYLDVPLAPKHRAEYDHLESTSLLEHARDPIVGTNAAVLRGKMLQMCSGAVYSKEGRYRIFDRTRYELIADLVEERKHPSISFFLWQHQKHCLSEELTKRKISHAILDGKVIKRGARAQIVADFQHGRIQHLIIQPHTGAHGFTLTAGRTAIWCSPVYQPDLFKQGIHRIYRGGQVHKTETICIRAPRTVEEVVYDSMNTRKARMGNFLDLIAARK